MTALVSVNEALTAITRARYDRIASVYDGIECFMELGARRWRRDLWKRVQSGKVLELGVGTGKNIPYYPASCDVTAIDISPRMLARAERRLRPGMRVRLELADAQRLPYGDGAFDFVVATFVFCSVPDPVLALSEARRVLKPNGELVLLEHVLSERALLRPLMRRVDPTLARLFGAHIARETVATVREAGFVELSVRDLMLDVVKQIRARAPQTSLPSPSVA